MFSREEVNKVQVKCFSMLEKAGKLIFGIHSALLEMVDVIDPRREFTLDAAKFTSGDELPYVIALHSYKTFIN